MKLSPSFRSVGVRRLAALAASTFFAVTMAPTLQAGPPAEPTQSAATGTIKGRLVWAGGDIPTPKVEAAAAKSNDPVCKTKPIISKELTIDPDTKGVANGFAYLLAPTGDYSATEKALLAKHPEVIVDQIGCEYVPYASVAVAGQKVLFKSTDPVGHNVMFKPFNSANPSMNPMLPPNGSYTYSFKKAEKLPTKAECSIHSWMAGYVLLVDHPFAVVTKADGSFEITGVPAGEQHLVVWHSTNGRVNEGGNKGMTVTVKAGETTDVGEFKVVDKKK
jgi:plastocyanin